MGHPVWRLPLMRLSGPAHQRSEISRGFWHPLIDRRAPLPSSLPFSPLTLITKVSSSSSSSTLGASTIGCGSRNVKTLHSFKASLKTDKLKFPSWTWRVDNRLSRLSFVSVVTQKPVSGNSTGRFCTKQGPTS